MKLALLFGRCELKFHFGTKLHWMIPTRKTFPDHYIVSFFSDILFEPNDCLLIMSSCIWRKCDLFEFQIFSLVFGNSTKYYHTIESTLGNNRIPSKNEKKSQTYCVVSMPIIGNKWLADNPISITLIDKILIDWTMPNSIFPTSDHNIWQFVVQRMNVGAVKFSVMKFLEFHFQL